MIAIQIASIEGNAKNRPAGYIEDCKAHSESWQDGKAIFTKENWDALYLKYRGASQTRDEDCGCNKRKSSLISSATPQAFTAQNHQICDVCDLKLMCPIWTMLSLCNRKKALTGDPMYPCPEGKFAN